MTQKKNLWNFDYIRNKDIIKSNSKSLTWLALNTCVVNGGFRAPPNI